MTWTNLYKKTLTKLGKKGQKITSRVAEIVSLHMLYKTDNLHIQALKLP